ncbi:hypothetical protein CLAFUW4_08152 [Fulvia fulva]|uniref:Uncharacterized protein n=1 Tax=Passalora fulva TaxID=5499 RepID=A0A9Q8LDR4_PASFU|nr:uncharacterized protein CLAFUR5_08266 [Fulvia fulva]KAK4629424.1 hypothetical protein CLAFUR4_08157 [Fulvia fulva]UJO15536.1 hypothetical protein CLAFUR5_08266 [Fulvia fulva]WPV12641.1 hypothetical protein CLAFUW4_08152 [Fulvia fulva]WPV27382.1 hypothetical protein CLAFUW7_08152 [Fulvia fulva]
MKRMPLEDDVLTCVSTDSVNERAGPDYFATILHGTGMEEGPFSVREVTIKWKDPDRGEEDRSTPAIKSRRLGPMSVIAVLSSLVSVSLLIWAALIRDGVAVIGIIAMSFTAPLLCAGSRYQLQFPRWSPGNEAAPGDVVFRTRDGAFTVVHCDVDIARLLYFAPEAPEYSMNLYTNRLSGGVVGGLMLIVSITLFGNCSWTMQAALAVTYALLNVAYWVSAILLERHSWRFDKLTITKEQVIKTDKSTAALWFAIHKSRSTNWVKAGRANPDTSAWNQWLKDAEQHTYQPAEMWDPARALRDLYRSELSMVF